MEWEFGLSRRGKILITKKDGMLFVEPVWKDNQNIRNELIKLINKADYVTFQDVIDFFDVGTMLDRDRLIQILQEITK